MKHQQIIVKWHRALLGLVGLVALAGFAVGCGNQQSSSTSASTTTTAGTAAAKAVVAKAKADVAAAESYGTRWDGPATGVHPRPGKRIVFIANGLGGSSAAVALDKAIEQAASAIGWTVTTLDGKSSVAETESALGQAIALKPDGIILGSIDAKSHLAKLEQAEAAGILVVGWHSAATTGPQRDLHLYANISTDPVAIGHMLAQLAIADSNGTAQAIVVTDDLYAVAKAKAQAMKAGLESCSGCKVLDYAQAPVADIQTRTGPAILALYQRYAQGGKVKPLYFLTITDLNYNVAVPALRAAGVPPDAVRLLGTDGEPAAYQRIRRDYYQTVTVPEPITFQGWQAVDEMTRALAGQPWSGYTPKVYPVTKSNVDAQGGRDNLFIPENGFEQHYKAIWGVR